MGSLRSPPQHMSARARDQPVRFTFAHPHAGSQAIT